MSVEIVAAYLFDLRVYTRNMLALDRERRNCLRYKDNSRTNGS